MNGTEENGMVVQRPPTKKLQAATKMEKKKMFYHSYDFSHGCPFVFSGEGLESFGLSTYVISSYIFISHPLNILLKGWNYTDVSSIRRAFVLSY